MQETTISILADCRHARNFHRDLFSFLKSKQCHMKDILVTPPEIEQLKIQIEVEEFKYKIAISRNKSYVVLKRIKSKIRELKINLQQLTEAD